MKRTFEKTGYAAQLADIRWRLRLWPTGWWFAFGYDGGVPFFGFARYDHD